MQLIHILKNINFQIKYLHNNKKYKMFLLIKYIIYNQALYDLISFPDK